MINIHPPPQKKGKTFAKSDHVSSTCEHFPRSCFDPPKYVTSIVYNAYTCRESHLRNFCRQNHQRTENVWWWRNGWMVGLSKSTFCPDNCLHGCCIIERYCNCKNTTSRSYGNAIFNTLNLLGSFMFVCKSFFSKCDMVENCWEPERRKVHCTSCRLDSSKQNSLQERIQHQRQWGKDLRWDHLMLRPQFENTWTPWICPCLFSSWSANALSLSDQTHLFAKVPILLVFL